MNFLLMRKMVKLKQTNHTNNWTNEQIERLDSISRRMTDFIKQGKYELIDDLDRLRKKIIVDVTKKKNELSIIKKNNILKLVHKNKEMIFFLKEKKEEELKNIKQKSNCAKAYSKNI